MSRGIRALAPLGALALALWAGPAAVPHPGEDPIIDLDRCQSPATPAPTPSPNPNRCTPRADQVVFGKWMVVARVDPGTGHQLRKVELYLESSEDPSRSPCYDDAAKSVGPVLVLRSGSPTPTPRQACPVTGSIPSSGATVQFEWDTTVQPPDNTPSFNGRYKIRLVAENDPTTDPGGNVTTKEITGIRVDNPPAIPPAPSVTGASSDGVFVAWTEFTPEEPDFVAYVLWRARTDAADRRPREGDFRQAGDPICSVGTKKVFDEVPGPGAWWYRLQVVRRSVTNAIRLCGKPDGTIASDLSEASSRAGVVVATPAPTAPPTVTPPPTPPPLTPRPLPKPPTPRPTPNVFQPLLPFGTVEPQETTRELALPSPSREPARPASRGAVVPVAVGALLLSAAMLIGRMPR